MRTHMPLLLLLCLALGNCCQAAQEGFRLHSRYTGIGACLKTLVGPGPEPGTERLYASHIYGPEVLDLVAIDPVTGKIDVFESAVPGEVGAWAMALAADGQVYLGGLPAAHIQRVDWEQRKLVDMGRPSATESYIWQLALAADKRLYGCTYPGAKLVRFDPATGASEDLGRMDDQQQYARSVAADDHGFVYVGIGMDKMHLVAFEIATGEHRDVLPAELVKPGCVSVHRGEDGRVYAVAGGPCFVMDGWTAIPVEHAQVRPAAPTALADGSTVRYASPYVTVTTPDGREQTVATDYKGKEKAIFRLGLGPDDKLYASTAMPIHFLRADPDSEAWEELGVVGGGEFYSFLAWEDKLIGAAYSGDAPVMIYKPGEPWGPSNDPTGNPWRIHYAGEDSGWRPMALIAGPQRKAYLGAVSGYGLLGGPICVLDPATGVIEQYPHVVEDHSVIALAALPDGSIAGGTTVGGGGGSRPTQTEAKLLLWDPVKREKTFETVPLPGASSIEALATGADGLVYGFAAGKMFIFDPVARGDKHRGTRPGRRGVQRCGSRTRR